jgi:hypothetical protein
LATLKAVFKAIYRGWMKFAYLLGTINRFIFMTVFYWVIIDVTNIVLRILRVDLLDRRMSQQGTYWHSKPVRPATYKHQF